MSKTTEPTFSPELIDELGDIQHEIKVLTERADAIKEQIKALGDAGYQTDNYKLTVSTRRGRLDEVAFAREFDAESFPELWTSKPVVNAEVVKRALSPDELDTFYTFTTTLTIKENN